MLLSAVLTLQPVEPATVPAHLGREAHAWFLSQVRAHDPALAEQLHSGQELRPFTVSDLAGPKDLSGRPVTLAPERTYTLRVTSFSPGLSALLRERILPPFRAEADDPHPGPLPSGERETVVLAGASLRAVGCTTDPARSPWAAEATFEGLVQQFTLSPHLPRSAGLRFASPTAFRVTGKKWVVPLPLPALVFGGLLDRWNAFSPIQLHPDLRRFAEECVSVSSHRLETRRVSFGEEGERGSLTGFTGRCWYGFEVADRYWMGLVHLLAGFSLFAGAGLRTTMGMGQVRRLEVGG